MEKIATILTDFPEKFGIPRQSGRIEALKGKIVFEPKFATPDAVKGLENYNYLWLLWKFDISEDLPFRATVRPPRLGGNTRVGVFATRSPFRPNHIVLYVSGIDMANGTEILDIKPYIPYTDLREDAVGSFAEEYKDYALHVTFPDELLQRFPEEKRAGIFAVLSDDPRPSYQDDPERIYGVSFAGFNVQFQVSGN